MSLLRRRREEPEPLREPHPDPRVEAVLLRVMSLQQTIERKHRAADQAMAGADSAARKSLGGGGDYATDKLNTATSLRKAAEKLEAEIAALHDEIDQRLAALGDDALFLVPAPVRTRARAREEGR